MMLALNEPTRADLHARFTAHFAAGRLSQRRRSAECASPCWWVHDEDDNVAPFAQGAALASAIPHATLWRTRAWA